MQKLNVKVLLLILVFTTFNSEIFAQTRIRFARGRTSASVSGAIGGNDSRSFVLGARYGQYLSANVSSRNGCVLFDNGSTSNSFTTDSGSNYLYLSNRCGRQTSFTLTISISR